MIRFTCLLCLLSQQVLAFVVPNQHNAMIVSSDNDINTYQGVAGVRPIFATTSSGDYDGGVDEGKIRLVDVVLPVQNKRRGGIVSSVFSRIKCSFTGIVTGLSCFVARGMAADDYEIAELPPPYVPALFGVVLLVGVGLLTSSLGNVMDEEASLGLQSGARAKKEIERSRSSYFKRK